MVKTTIIVLIIVSSISVSVSKQPPNPTNENPSSRLPTQNKKPITAPIITPRQGDEFNSIPSLSLSEGVQSGTTEPELAAVQTIDLPVAPFPAERASPPPPENQSETTTFLSRSAMVEISIIVLIIASSISVSVSKQPPNLSNEIPSSSLPTQNREPVTAPIVTPRQGDAFNSIPSLSPSQGVQSGTTEPELAAVQTIDFTVPPFPAERASPPPPDNQSETRAFSDHANPNQNPPFRINPQNFQHQILPISVPWCQRNALMENEGGQQRNEYHRMDRLSECVLNYFLMGGLSRTATWAERPALSTSIYIQCFLHQVAFSLFLLAHLVFPCTNPASAFIMDRVSFSLIVISGYLSTMPMYPPYIAIIMLLLVVIVNIFSHFRA